MALTLLFQDKLDCWLFHALGWHKTSSTKTCHSFFFFFCLLFFFTLEFCQRLRLHWQWVEFCPSVNPQNSFMDQKMSPAGHCHCFFGGHVFFGFFVLFLFFFTGLLLAATSIGPAFGFITGSFMLRFYVDFDKLPKGEGSRCTKGVRSPPTRRITPPFDWGSFWRVVSRRSSSHRLRFYFGLSKCEKYHVRVIAPRMWEFMSDDQ